jgi:hypothetical protein
VERLPKDDYNNPFSWTLRAASYAALGQTAKAKAAVSDALAHAPDLTIEGLTGTGFWSDSERKWMIERMRAAEFQYAPQPKLWRKTRRWCVCRSACRNEH